jgi:hypothetical protein
MGFYFLYININLIKFIVAFIIFIGKKQKPKPKQQQQQQGLEVIYKITRRLTLFIYVVFFFKNSICIYRHISISIF